MFINNADYLARFSAGKNNIKILGIVKVKCLCSTEIVEEFSFVGLESQLVLEI